MHVSRCARVLTRHPAAQPGCLRPPSESADVSSSQPCGGPKVLGPRAAAFPRLGRHSPTTGKGPGRQGYDHMIRTIFAGRPLAAAIALPWPSAGRSFARRRRARRAKDVIKTYADIAQAGYTDSLRPAEDAQARDRCLPRQADRATISRAARAAWIAARIPYMQTEAFASATRSSTIGRAG